MDLATALFTIAQVAMTLTGFAGLLIAFRFGKGKWQRVEVYAVHFLLKSSVGAFVFALLPLPMMVGGFDSITFWALCFFALGIWSLLLVFGAFRARFRGDLRPRYELGYWGLTLCGLLIGILEILAAVGTFGLRNPTLYMFGLFWLLAVATFQLVMQVMASLHSMDAD